MATPWITRLLGQTLGPSAVVRDSNQQHPESLGYWGRHPEPLGYWGRPLDLLQWWETAIGNTLNHSAIGADPWTFCSGERQQSATPWTTRLLGQTLGPSAVVRDSNQQRPEPLGYWGRPLDLLQWWEIAISNTLNHSAIGAHPWTFCSSERQQSATPWTTLLLGQTLGPSAVVRDSNQQHPEPLGYWGRPLDLLQWWETAISNTLNHSAIGADPWTFCSGER